MFTWKTKRCYIRKQLIDDLKNIVGYKKWKYSDGKDVSEDTDVYRACVRSRVLDGGGFTMPNQVIIIISELKALVFKSQACLKKSVGKLFSFRITLSVGWKLTSVLLLERNHSTFLSTVSLVSNVPPHKSTSDCHISNTMLYT